MNHTFANSEISNWYFNKDKSSLLVESKNGKIAKIGSGKHPRKNHSLIEEFEVLKRLSGLNCQSCPKPFEAGFITTDDLVNILGEEIDEPMFVNTRSLQYYTMELLRRDQGYQWSDVMLAVEEQRALGVYHGDIKPDNIAFDSTTGACKLIDYDQSVRLDEFTQKLDIESFIDYMDKHDLQRYGVGNWLRHFNTPGAPLERDFDLPSLYHVGRLDVSATSIMKKQRTTNSATGIYHTIDTPKLFASGSRDLSGRKPVLDKLNFKPEEKVLDVGCNSGLLCWYLDDRGCTVYGVDNDQSIAIAAQQFSNIEGRKINFSHMDLDEVVDIVDTYDTVFLFSVLHHTRDHVANAMKISKACNRIVIETRLTESGKQPGENGQWNNTTAWRAPNLDVLVSHLESIFVGHKFVQNVGSVDKHRFILEFSKQQKE